MLADVHILHQSDVYRIEDFRCNCNICSITDTEYNNSLCICFLRRGFFEYRTFRRKDELYVGRVLVSKPEFEHVTRHIDAQPDISTVFEFSKEFFKKIQSYSNKEAAWFLRNNDLHSMMVACSPQTEYLHQRILQKIQSGNTDNLLIDEMVMEILNQVLLTLGNVPDVPLLPGNIRKYHLTTVEKAKEYIQEHFKENISIQQLAEHCLVSPFHFSRIFKKVMLTSPHQYLLATRLEHAKILLTASEKPIGDIAFDCGFNSLEYFVTAYKKVNKITPGEYRLQA